MRILFVHQNFPGQYRHVLQALAERGHSWVGLGIRACPIPIPPGCFYGRYAPQRGNTAGIHPWALELETKLIRGEACGEAALALQRQGFQPDLICAHPGWGEPLFLKDLWPDVPLLCYQEFFYRYEGYDVGFDPEFQRSDHWHGRARTRMKNTHLLQILEAADWNVSPTAFQRSSFPRHWQERISLIHDGIDTDRARPDPAVAPLPLADGTLLQPGESIVTFVNRRLEPYRGCHTFIRALPELQRLRPDARVVIVGATTGVSYGPPCPEGEWNERFLAEIEGRYDASRVHFTGTLGYDAFLHLLQLSACHVYLTYPFVLSWSLLEAMSCGCAVVGSATAPVQDLIRDGVNGRLVDFFQAQELAAAVAALLEDREQARRYGEEARRTILADYALSSCLPRHLALMDLVAHRALGIGA
jgi:glycosyltransferase involved in cell wall biosynthesis